MPPYVVDSKLLLQHVFFSDDTDSSFVVWSLNFALRSHRCALPTHALVPSVLMFFYTASVAAPYVPSPSSAPQQNRPSASSFPFLFPALFRFLLL